MILNLLNDTKEKMKEKNNILIRRKSAQQFKGQYERVSRRVNELKELMQLLEAMKKKNIISESPVRDSYVPLKTVLEACKADLKNRSMTEEHMDAVSEYAADWNAQVRSCWAESARARSEVLCTSLNSLAFLLDDPADARNKVQRIRKAVGELPKSAKEVGAFIAVIDNARKKIDALDAGEDIKNFVAKVSQGNASFEDMTPQIIQWLEDKKLKHKIKISF